jgi:hypothetical protein
MVPWFRGQVDGSQEMILRVSIDNKPDHDEASVHCAAKARDRRSRLIEVNSCTAMAMGLGLPNSSLVKRVRQARIGPVDFGPPKDSQFTTYIIAPECSADKWV